MQWNKPPILMWNLLSGNSLYSLEGGKAKAFSTPYPLAYKFSGKLAISVGFFLQVIL
ncbi:MAG: hypothetical protein HRF42_01775 [Candidatus Brocadia sp.]|jgi:hypothetical protein